MLDYPEPPYDVQKRPLLIFGIIGFMMGIVLTAGYSSLRLLIKYISEEAGKAIYGEKNENAGGGVAVP